MNICPSKQSNTSFTWITMTLLWFIIFSVFFWLIYFSLTPKFVMSTSNPGQVDETKVLICSIVSSIILVAVIIILKYILSSCTGGMLMSDTYQSKSTVINILIFWFIITTLLFWLVFYSLEPWFVMTSDERDNAKVLLSATLSSILVVLVVIAIRYLLRM